MSFESGKEWKNTFNRGRKNVGVLIDWTVDPFQQMFLEGVMDFAKKN